MSPQRYRDFLLGNGTAEIPIQFQMILSNNVSCKDLATDHVTNATGFGLVGESCGPLIRCCGCGEDPESGCIPLCSSSPESLTFWVPPLAAGVSLPTGVTSHPSAADAPTLAPLLRDALARESTCDSGIAREVLKLAMSSERSDDGLLAARQMRSAMRLGYCAGEATGTTRPLCPGHASPLINPLINPVVTT